MLIFKDAEDNIVKITPGGGVESVNVKQVVTLDASVGAGRGGDF